MCPEGFEETEDACVQTAESGEWQKARAAWLALPRAGASQTLENCQVRINTELLQWTVQKTGLHSAHPGSWRRRVQQELERPVQGRI